jgi:hypothetical protein
MFGLGVGLTLSVAISGEAAAAYPPEDLVAWPDATNTGVPTGTSLTAQAGDYTTTSNGQVVDRLAVTNGTIIVAHTDVTVQRCTVTTTGTYGIQIQSGKTGCIVRDCEISGAQTGIQGFGTFLRNDISGTENGIVVANGSGVTIKDNYIHDLFAAIEPHYDGIASQGGSSNVLIQHNWISGTESATIQGIFISDEGGAADNIDIVDNYIAHCTFNITVGATGITNATVTDNTLKQGSSGFYNFTALGMTVSGNVSTRGYYIDGDAVPAVGSTAFTPSSAMSGNDANINTGFRVMCTLAAVGTEYRVIFKSGVAGTDLRGMAIGKRSSGVNSALALQELEFGGVTLATTAEIMTASTEIVSDWFTPPAAFSVSDAMIVGFNMENPGGTALASSASNATSYFGSTTGYDDAAPAGYSESAGNVFAIKRIEYR